MYRVLLYICLLLAISSVSIADSLKPAHSAEISVEELLECSESKDSSELDEAPLWNSLPASEHAESLPYTLVRVPRAPVFILSSPIRAPPTQPSIL